MQSFIQISMIIVWKRFINVCNSLPTNVDFSSLSKFKRSINLVDLPSYLKDMTWIWTNNMILMGDVGLWNSEFVTTNC